jgi:hypothetical protein
VEDPDTQGVVAAGAAPAAAAVEAVLAAAAVEAVLAVGAVGAVGAVVLAAPAAEDEVAPVNSENASFVVFRRTTWNTSITRTTVCCAKC